MLIAVFLVVVAVIIVVASIMGNTEPVTTETEQPMKVRLVTSKGDIVIQLRDDMPITTENFRNLVDEGVYDHTIFHRVMDGFMIQGGQVNQSVPSIQDEFSNDNRNLRGTIAMAKKADLTTGQVVPDSASSQFFINVVNNSNENFDGDYSVFGTVTEGMDVVDEIAKVDVIVDAENDHKPVEDVIIYVATLEE